MEVGVARGELVNHALQDDVVGRVVGVEQADVEGRLGLQQVVDDEQVGRDARAARNQGEIVEGGGLELGGI